MMPFLDHFDRIRRTPNANVKIDDGGGGVGEGKAIDQRDRRHEGVDRAEIVSTSSNLEGKQRRHNNKNEADLGTMELLRPSIVNNFQAASLRESFQRRLSSLSSSDVVSKTAAPIENYSCYHDNYDDDGVMDWPSRVSSLGSRSFLGKHSSSSVPSSDADAGDQKCFLTGRNGVDQPNDRIEKLGAAPTSAMLSRYGIRSECSLSNSTKKISQDRQLPHQQQLQPQHTNARMEQDSATLTPMKSNDGLHSGHRIRPSNQPCKSSIIDENEEDDDEDDDDDDDDCGSMVSSLDSLASPVSRVLKKSLRIKHPPSSLKSTPTTSSTSLDTKASVVDIISDDVAGQPNTESTTTTPNNNDIKKNSNNSNKKNISNSNYNNSNNNNRKKKKKNNNRKNSNYSPHLRRTSSFNNHKRQSSSDDKSLGIDDLRASDNDGSFITIRDSFRASGLGSDIALHLEYSTKSMNSYYSSDGIDHLHPSDATDKGRDDFEFAWNAYSEAILFGHFGFIRGDGSGIAGHAVVSMEGDDDQVLAAKAYLGLGFVRQCKGELGSSLDAYLTSLNLWENAMGENNVPSHVVPSILYNIGTVLVEMQRLVEASDYFTKALHLFKNGSNNHDSTNEEDLVNISSTEGMLFNVFGDANRAIICFRKAALGLQSASGQSMSLKLATVMYEMGSLHSALEMYDESVNCFNVALGIRKSLLKDSFLVARTHYSLGVTLASQELKTNLTSASESHLEEALRICEKEFESEHIQSAIIFRALGVLNDSKGDSLAASVWFAKELALRKLLLGDEHESVATACADLGTCYYNSGKYELAISRFADCLRIILLRLNTDRSLEVADTLYKIASCHDRLCNFDKALEIFLKVKDMRESYPNVGSDQVIYTMLRIGNIHLCQGEIEKALEHFSEVLGIGYTDESVSAVAVANAFYGRGCAQFCEFHLTDAMKSFSESLNWKLAALGENDPGLACIFYQMAHVHLQQSEPEEAITCLEEFVRLQKLDKQRNLQDSAEICYAEGIIAKLNGRQDIALSFFFQALAMFETLFGDNHEKAASILFDIGSIYSATGNYVSAINNYQNCLLRRRRILGDHVDVANTLYEMATVHYKADNPDLARDCLIESDRIWRAKLTNSEKLSTVLVLSANLWKSLQSYEAAEKNFEQALESAIALHGKDHELVASILLQFGEFLHEISQFQQAIFCFDESIRVRTLLFGAESPDTAQVEYSKGVALLFHSDFEGASSCLNRALTIRQQALGPMDEAVGDTFNTIGFLHLRMGSLAGDEALGLLTKALEIRQAIGNKTKIISTLQNIASVYKKRKEFDSYLETLIEMLTVRQAAFGSNDARVADAWVQLGSTLVSLGRLHEATVSYEEALRVQIYLRGPNHSSVARILFKFGSLHSKRNKFAEAKDMLEKYARIRAAEVDDPDEEMAKALTMLGDIQKETGEKSKALTNWTSAIKIYHQLGYEEDNPKLLKLRERQKTISFIDTSSNSMDISWRSMGNCATTRHDSGWGNQRAN